MNTQTDTPSATPITDAFINNVRKLERDRAALIAALETLTNVCDPNDPVVVSARATLAQVR